MNDGVPIKLEHWIQIITTIPEFLSTDHSLPQTFGKRIITAKARAEIRKGYLKNNFGLIFSVRVRYLLVLVDFMPRYIKLGLE